MGECSKWTTFIAFVLVSLRLAGARKAAMDDICARGAYAFCPNNARQQPAASSSSNAHRDLPQPSQSPPNNGPPRAPFSATPPPLPTLGEYCMKYQEHYNYYCMGANSKDPKAAEFCPTYITHCVDSPVEAGSAPTATTPIPELPPAKIQQVCTDYQPMANLYCFRPQIPKGWGVRKNCDMYLKYCVGTANDQLQKQNKTMKQALKENIKPCAKFENDYIGFCVQNPTPYNNNIAEFCRNYKGTCVPMQVPTGDALLPTVDVAQTQPQPQVQFVPVPAQTQVQQVAVPVVQQVPVQQVPVQAVPVQQVPVQQVPVQAVPVAAQPGSIGVPSNLNGVPTSPLISPSQLGNPNVISDPLGSLSAAPPMGNPGANMIRGMQGSGLDANGNPLTGMAANPLAVGSQTMVGNIAGASRGTAVNPFGQVASGTNVVGGPVGIQSGTGVDFSGIPGLSQIGSMLGRRRRKRDTSLVMWVLAR